MVLSTLVISALALSRPSLADFDEDDYRVSESEIDLGRPREWPNNNFDLFNTCSSSGAGAGGVGNRLGPPARVAQQQLRPFQHLLQLWCRRRRSRKSTWAARASGPTTTSTFSTPAPALVPAPEESEIDLGRPREWPNNNFDLFNT